MGDDKKSATVLTGSFAVRGSGGVCADRYLKSRRYRSNPAAVVDVEASERNHRYRNLLQALVGQIAIARRRAARGEPVLELLEEIERVARSLTEMV